MWSHEHWLRDLSSPARGKLAHVVAFALIGLRHPGGNGSWSMARQLAEQFLADPVHYSTAWGTLVACAPDEVYRKSFRDWQRTYLAAASRHLTDPAANRRAVVLRIHDNRELMRRHPDAEPIPQLARPNPWVGRPVFAAA